MSPERPTDPQQTIDFNSWTAPRIGEKPADEMVDRAEPAPDSKPVESPAQQLESEIQSQWATASEDQRHEWHNQMLGLTGDTELSFQQFVAKMDAKPPAESPAAPLDVAPAGDIASTVGEALPATEEAPTPEAGEPTATLPPVKKKPGRRPVDQAVKAAAEARYAEIREQLNAATSAKQAEFAPKKWFRDLSPDEQAEKVREHVIKNNRALIAELDKVKKRIAAPVKTAPAERTVDPQSASPVRPIESGPHLEFSDDLENADTSAKLGTEFAEASDAARPQLADELRAAETEPIAPPENLPVVSSEDAPIAEVPEQPNELSATAPAAETAAIEEEPDMPATALDVGRKTYATALRQRAWIFGRTSDQKLEAANKNYQELLKTETTERLQKVKEKYADRDLKDPVVQAELMAEISGVLIDLRQGEEGRFRAEMKNEQEKSIGNNIRKLWNSSSKARLVIGLGLMGSGITMTAFGQLWAIPFITTARVVMSSAGTTMTAEAGQKWLREKTGDTKKRTQEEIDQMGLPELKKLLAAHTMSYVDAATGQQFGTRKRLTMKKGKFDSQADDTGKMIEEAYRQKMKSMLEAEVKGEIAEKSLDDVVATMTDRALDSELHKEYESAREEDRKFSRRKWAVAGVTGAIAGAASYFLGTHGKGGEHGITTPRTGAEADMTKVAIPDSAHTDSVKTTAKVGAWLKSAHEQAGAVAGQPVETVVEAHRGDTVWGLLKEQLHDRMGDAKWTQLGEAGQTNAVANALEHVKDNPAGFGLSHGIDHLNVGDKVDLSPLFTGDKALNIAQMFEHSQQLTSNADVAKFIVDNNHAIAQWHLEHPNQFMSTEVIQQILNEHHGVVKGVAKAGQAAVESATQGTVASGAAAEVPTYQMMPDGSLSEVGAPAGAAADSAANVHVAESAGQAASGAAEHALKLPPEAVKAFGEYRDLHDTWTMNWSEAADKQFDQSLDKLMMRDIVKRGTIEKFLSVNNPQAEHHTLVELSKKMWHLIRELPKDAYQADDSLGDVLRTVDDSIK